MTEKQLDIQGDSGAKSVFAANEFEQLLQKEGEELNDFLKGRPRHVVLEPEQMVHGFSLQIPDEATITARIAARNAAKAAKDYARADAIRAELAAQGIIIKDTADGTEWRYE